MTTWDVQSHRTGDRLCPSCIGSSFLPRGAFRKRSLCRWVGECTPDRSEALWVTRPEAAASASSEREDGGQGVAPALAGARVRDGSQFLNERQRFRHTCLLRFETGGDIPTPPVFTKPNRETALGVGNRMVAGRPGLGYKDRV